MAGVIRDSVILGCGNGRMGCTVFGGITLGSGDIWVGGTLGSGAVCFNDCNWVDGVSRGVVGGVTLGAGITCN